MADLPSLEQVATGGVLGAILAAMGWLINWFRGLATHGEDLADRRIAALTADFEAYRARTHLELQELREEMVTVRHALRVCRTESDQLITQLAAVRVELDVLKQQRP